MSNKNVNKNVVKAVALGLSATVAAGSADMTAFAANDELSVPEKVVATEVAAPVSVTPESAIKSDIASEQAKVDAVMNDTSATDGTATAGVSSALNDVLDEYSEDKTSSYADAADDAEALEDTASDLTDAVDDYDEAMDAAADDYAAADAAKQDAAENYADALEAAADATTLANDTAATVDEANDTIVAQTTLINGTSDLDEAMDAMTTAQEAYDNAKAAYDEAVDKLAELENDYNTALDNYDAAVDAYNAAITQGDADLAAAKAAVAAAQTAVDELEAEIATAEANLAATGADAMVAYSEAHKDDTKYNWTAQHEQFANIVTKYYVTQVLGGTYDEEEGCSLTETQFHKGAAGTGYWTLTYLDENGELQTKLLNYSLSGTNSGFYIYETSLHFHYYSYVDENGQVQTLKDYAAKDQATDFEKALADGTIKVRYSYNGNYYYTLPDGVTEDTEGVTKQYIYYYGENEVTTGIADTTYDAQGRKTSEELTSADDTVKTTVWSYNEDGTLVKTVTKGSITKTYTYQSGTLTGSNYTSQQAAANAGNGATYQGTLRASGATIDVIYYDPTTTTFNGYTGTATVTYNQRYKDTQSVKNPRGFGGWNPANWDQTKEIAWNQDRAWSQNNSDIRNYIADVYSSKHNCEDVSSDLSNVKADGHDYKLYYFDGTYDVYYNLTNDANGTYTYNVGLTQDANAVSWNSLTSGAWSGASAQNAATNRAYLEDDDNLGYSNVSATEHWSYSKNYNITSTTTGADEYTETSSYSVSDVNDGYNAYSKDYKNYKDNKDTTKTAADFNVLSEESDADYNAWLDDIQDKESALSTLKDKLSDAKTVLANAISNLNTITANVSANKALAATDLADQKASLNKCSANVETAKVTMDETGDNLDKAAANLAETADALQAATKRILASLVTPRVDLSGFFTGSPAEEEEVVEDAGDVAAVNNVVAATPAVATTIADAATPLADATEDDTEEATEIEDEETPEAAVTEEESHMNWWWLILVVIAGLGAGTYYYQSKKKAAVVKTDDKPSEK